MITFPRGSEWRKWDLHVHTPESVLNPFPGGWEDYIRQVIDKALEVGVSVIGVTDYFTLDGYKKFRGYLTNRAALTTIFADRIRTDSSYLERIAAITLMPNVELRLDTRIDRRRINLHVLFSEELAPEIIEANFLHSIFFDFSASAGAAPVRRRLTGDNIKELGAQTALRDESFAGRDPFRIGAEVLTLKPEDITKPLREASDLFKNKYLIVLSEEKLSDMNWGSQSANLRLMLSSWAHMIFSGNPASRSHFLSSDAVKAYGRRKPCIWGSDAHSLERLFSPDKARFCWIKADPTFRGLLQLLQEPADRCFIGAEPPMASEIRTGGRLYLESVSFNQVGGSDLGERWFAGVSVPLNPGLVAVIGNKGSGKSALADSIGLLGEARIPESQLSFLSPTRFRSKDGASGQVRARHFKVAWRWSDGQTGEKLLSGEVRLDLPERLRYLPQGYVESICASPDPADRKQFQAEIDRVIFSHVPIEERMGADSLQELIEMQQAAFKQSLSDIKQGIRSLNRRIVALEDETSDENRQRLAALVKARQQDLATLKSQVPPPVAEPAIAGPDTERTVKALETSRKESHDLSESIGSEQTALASLNGLLTGLEQATERLRAAERGHQLLIREVEKNLLGTDVAVSRVVQFTVDLSPIASRRAELISERDGRRAELARLQARAEEVRKSMEQARSELDAPRQRYEAYRAEHAAWEAKCAAVLGEVGVEGSIRDLEARASRAATTAVRELAEIRRAREQSVRETFDVLARHVAALRLIYRPVENFIRQSERRGQSTGLALSVSLEAPGFVNGFLNLVTQAAKGSFHGEKEGRARANSILGSGRCETPEGLLKMLAEVAQALQEDQRNASLQPRRLDDQLAKGIPRRELYDYLYSLDYLEPVYGLRLHGRPFDQLSPGERGLLLLMFYLAIDRETCPLVMDQPEENLDNQTVKQSLVERIRDAKARRQIIIVTHNPNLAVVADAEQIIYAEHSHTATNEITYASGSLENAEMSRHVVDVLEGTAPAFRARHGKYSIVGTIE